MSLYRNIAGFKRMGAFLPAPTTATITSPVLLQPLIDVDAATTSYYTEQTARYDHAMSESPSQLRAEGIFMIPNDPTLWIGDPATGSGRAWLPIQDTQYIENLRNTAGALMLHMQQVELAQDTAGYEGGGSASGGSAQVTDPLPQVQTTMPVVEPTIQVTPIATPSEPTQPTQPISTIPLIDTPISTPAITPVAPGTVNYWPLVTTAGILMTAFGVGFIKKRRKLILLAGIGTLYYQLSKKQ